MVASRPDNPFRSTPSAGTVALVLCLLMPATSHAAKLYRWVDDEGNIHYTDRMPADATDEEHRVMDDRGTVVEERESSEVEREKRLEYEAREAEKLRKAREREERRRRDRIIMQTFTTARDIELTRKDRVEAVEVQINIVEHAIKRLRTERRRVERRLGTLPEDSPAAAQGEERLAEIDTQLEQRRTTKLRLETQREEIKERFDGYLRRFRELKPHAR